METYYIPGIYRNTDSGEKIFGKEIPACINNGGYHLVTLKVYADGLIDCWGLVDFKGFKEKVRDGWVTVEVPPGHRINMLDLFYGDTTGLTFHVKNEDLIKKVGETIRQLQGKSTASDRCLKAFLLFMRSPSEEARADVAKNYEMVAEHHRKYILGDQDVKDGPLRLLISAKETPKDIANWREWYFVRETKIL
jgi:hypothetical protein